MTIHKQQIIFEKDLIEVGSSHLYASFGTFCVQIGLSFESLWDLKLLSDLEIDLIFLKKTEILPFSNIFQRLTVTPKFD